MEAIPAAELFYDTISLHTLPIIGKILFVSTPKVKYSGHAAAYRSYNMMRQRCLNPKDPRFYDYGGRGIRICARWRKSFTAFLQDMGPRPEGTSIGRINNNGNYDPGNCKWQTRKQQQNNRKNSHLVEYKWFVMTVCEWAECLALNKSTLAKRLSRGWPVKDAFSIPISDDTWIRRRRNLTLPPSPAPSSALPAPGG